MKALILNSGTGSRMGSLTDRQPKCMTRLSPVESIIERQLRQIRANDISEVVITTGYLDEVLRDYVDGLGSRLDITYVKNENYRETNYIYSIYCAKDFLRDENVIMLHGDLVMEDSVIEDVIAADRSSMVVSKEVPLPQKDFKAVINDGRIEVISVDVFENAVAAQPLYKLLKDDWNVWLSEIERFCKASEEKKRVYAEDAFNEVSDKCRISPLNIGGRICGEIDNPADLEAMRMKLAHHQVDEFIRHNGSSIFLVSGCSLEGSGWGEYFDRKRDNGIKIRRFTDFRPNPAYGSVLAGKGKADAADSVIAIGGGSAMDVAKLIRKECADDGAAKPLLVIPTTAGTGSEATRYAVAYVDGIKQSYEDDLLMPDEVVFDPSVLENLSDYQKKSTAMDALCHAVESMWSINSTDESKGYSRQAIRLICGNIDAYIAGDKNTFEAMQEAAYLAGKAINIAQTTAGHAMCYGLTSKYGISHGHAAMLCVRELWPFMLRAKGDSCIDSRGSKYLKSVYRELAEAFGEEDPADGYREFQDIADGLELIHPMGNDEDIEGLVQTVNSTRLSNHPVRLSEDDLRKLYRKIVW